MAFIRSIALGTFLVSANAHGYLSKPVSRNALGKGGLASPACSWGGSPFPCNGDFMSLGGTSGPDITGCAAAGKGGLVTGNGGLSFASTGYKTSYAKGATIDVEIDVTAYHGGKFEFKLQDVGSNPDPSAGAWSAPLTVNSFSPTCGSACAVTEPCVAAKTCAQIPLTKGSHSGKYRIAVQLPADVQCEHCVLQWHWTSSNSCGNGLACSGSEQFWNCADIKIGSGNSGSIPTNDDTGDSSNDNTGDDVDPTPELESEPTPTPAPTPAPTPSPTPRPTDSSNSNNGGGSNNDGGSCGPTSCHSIRTFMATDEWCQQNCATMVPAYEHYCAWDTGCASTRRSRALRAITATRSLRGPQTVACVSTPVSLTAPNPTCEMVASASACVGAHGTFKTAFAGKDCAAAMGAWDPSMNFVACVSNGSDHHGIPTVEHVLSVSECAGSTKSAYVGVTKEDALKMWEADRTSS